MVPDTPWRISPDGRTASYQVESPHKSGVVVEARFTAQASQAVLWIRITNGSEQRLPRVKPLLCFHANPFFGDLEPGDSAEASGVIVFTNGALEPVVEEVVGLEWLRGAVLS